jgi:hypothetical protein
MICRNEHLLDNVLALLNVRRADMEAMDDVLEALNGELLYFDNIKSCHYFASTLNR